MQAMALSQLPVSIVEATLFSCVTYFMVGFYGKAGFFYLFWLVVAASNLCLSALFRLLAVVAPNATLAAAYGGLALLTLILTSGFAIVRGGFWALPQLHAHCSHCSSLLMRHVAASHYVLVMSPHCHVTFETCLLCWLVNCVR